MSLTVKAVFSGGKFGFDGRARRYNGDVFEIDEALFTSSWMERVEKTAVSRPAPEPVSEPASEVKPRRRRRKVNEAESTE